MRLVSAPLAFGMGWRSWLWALSVSGLFACGSPEDEPLLDEDEWSGAAPDAALHDSGAPDARRNPPPRPDAGGADGAASNPGCARPSWGPARTFELTHGAFSGSGHPDAAVYVPSHFDPCKAQGAVVFFHGFKNCVANVIGSEPTACTAGQPVRQALGLSAALEATHANAILIAVELKYDQATGAPGALANEGGTLSLLSELYTEHLSPWFEHDVLVTDLDRIVLTSHSGGYTALARALDRGGLPNISEAVLFDSLYGEMAVYEDFTLGQLQRFDTNAPDPLRFGIVYTSGGGTADESRALASELEAALAAEDRADALIFDDTTGSLDDGALVAPIVIKHSSLSHDGVVAFYFGPFVAAAGFPNRGE